MIDQYPYEGFGDMFPLTETTPEWVGVGHKHYVLAHSPVKHVILADGTRHSVIEVRASDAERSVERDIVDKLRGQGGERPHLQVTQELSYERTAGAGHWGQGMWQLPDTRPGL